MPSGTITTLSDTAVHLAGIADVIRTLGWTEAPLLKLFGWSSSKLSKLGRVTNWPSTELQWWEDTLNPVASTVAGAHNDITTTLAVAAGTGAYFRAGDVLLIGSTVPEKVLVTAVSADNLTVVRGLGDTSGQTLAGSETVTRITRAMPENSAATLGYSTTKNKKYNYTQIIDAAVSVSRTEQKAVKIADIDNVIDYEVAKLFNNGGAMGDLAKMLANIFYYGERTQRSTSPAYGTAGGFKTFVTTNVTDLNSASLQVSDIHSMMRSIRSYGGKVTHLIGNAWMMEKLNSFWPATDRVPSEKMGGQDPFDGIRTPHGVVKVVFDHMCPADELYFVNSERIGWLPFDEFRLEDASQPGYDGTQKKVVGEYTFFAGLEQTHGYIKEISTSS